MMISTRGRYALSVMVDLAEHNNGGYIPLKDVVQRQQISQKYLEAIMTTLSKAGLVDAQHGKSGGYRLNRAPDAYSLGEILRLTEGSLAPVPCIEPESGCSHASVCPTMPVWDELNGIINKYLDGITISDLLKQCPKAQE